MSELTRCVHTSVALEIRSPPSSSAPVSSAPEATAVPPVPPVVASLPPAQAAQTTRPQGVTELEEIKLAKHFLLAARLSNARLIETDKPPSLASFRAVWRSENAAGAVKVIPVGRDVTGVGIASDLISVDPLLCKGNFAAARSTEVVAGGVVFRATLSCTDAQNERTAQYFITPRQKGGFVVFAVIGNNRADPEAAAADVRKTDEFNRAAVQALGSDD
jgi:hypothetical protein